MDGNVIMGGDFNAKTNTKSDFVSDQSDDHSPVNDVPSYNFDKAIERQNRDKHLVDTYGQQLLNMCKNSQVRILNGRTRGDRMGKFTRLPLSLRETSSTIDYMIADTDILNNIKCFSILPHLGLSDHECLSLSLKTGTFTVETTEVTILKERPIKYASVDEFLMKLISPPIQEKLKKFQHTYSAPLDSVENMTDDLVDIINFSSTITSASKKKKVKKKGKGSEKGKEPWYSSECKKLKWALNGAEKDFRKHPFEIGKKEALFAARKKFKSFCKASERSFRNKISATLLAVEKNNPTEFWKAIDKMRKWGKSSTDPGESIPPPRSGCIIFKLS